MKFLSYGSHKIWKNFPWANFWLRILQTLFFPHYSHCIPLVSIVGHVDIWYSLKPCARGSHLRRAGRVEGGRGGRHHCTRMTNHHLTARMWLRPTEPRLYSHLSFPSKKIPKLPMTTPVPPNTGGSGTDWKSECKETVVWLQLKYLLQILQKIWACEHTAGAPLGALGGSVDVQGLEACSFLSFTMNTPWMSPFNWLMVVLLFWGCIK